MEQQQARPAPTVIENERLTPTFIGIVVVQILVIVALYWAGRFFGSAS
jgi:hypothetical protein